MEEMLHGLKGRATQEKNYQGHPTVEADGSLRGPMHNQSVKPPSGLGGIKFRI
jgi:hypothetical protein